MDRIVLTNQLVRRGFDRDEVERMRKAQQIRRVRRGAFSFDTGEGEGDPARAHRELIEATLPQLKADAVISHVSAAVLHGLPVWASDLTSVHVTRPRSAGGGKRRRWLRLHSQPLAPAELTEVAGIPATSLGRTVFDLARLYPLDRAVSAGDRAVALGMATELLTEMLERGSHWAGIRQARRVLDFIDGRAESPGESISRIRTDQFGLPAPQLQLPVRLRDGSMAYGDFGWPELRTIGEFDGRVKYQALLRPGESISDVVIREKRREDLLRELGW